MSLKSSFWGPLPSVDVQGPSVPPMEMSSLFLLLPPSKWVGSTWEPAQSGSRKEIDGSVMSGFTVRPAPRKIPLFVLPCAQSSPVGPEYSCPSIWNPAGVPGVPFCARATDGAKAHANKSATTPRDAQVRQALRLNTNHLFILPPGEKVRSRQQR